MNKQELRAKLDRVEGNIRYYQEEIERANLKIEAMTLLRQQLEAEIAALPS